MPRWPQPRISSLRSARNFWKSSRRSGMAWLLRDEASDCRLKMLLGGEKLWMRRAGIGGACCDGDRGINIESDRRQADFVVAGLVAQLEGDVLCTERSVGLRGERHAENDFILVHVERILGEGEGAEFTVGVGDFASEFETGREIGAEIGGDEVLGGRLARVDVEARADFEHDSELEGAAARYRFEGNVG